MLNPTPVLENDTHKVLWDIDVQTDQLISDKIYQQKKENLQIFRLCCSG